MTSARKFRKIELFKSESEVVPIQVCRKKSFVFGANEAMFSLGLKSNKTRVVDRDFCKYSYSLKFSEKLKRLFRIKPDCSAATINRHSGKVQGSKRLGVPGKCRKSFCFSKDGRFVVVSGFKKLYYLFSTVHGFKVVKIFQCNIPLNRVLFEARRFYVLHPKRKEVAYFDVLSLGSLLQARVLDVDKCIRQNDAMKNLRKRTHLVFQKLTSSGESQEIQLDLKLPKCLAFFDGKGKGKRLTRNQKKVNQLCSRLFDLENSPNKGLSPNRFLDFIEAKIGLYEAYLTK